MEDFLVDLDDRGFLLLGVFGSRYRGWSIKTKINEAINYF